MKNKIKTFAVIVAVATVSFADTKKPFKPTEPTFHVYKDRGDRLNHFIPSGFMGDYGDLKFNPGYYLDPSDKTQTCIKITYSAEKKQESGWAGIYWQTPANNWGDKKGGYDLSNYSKLTFRVRGDKGGEYIDKFMMGGISGITEEGDSDSAESAPIELKSEWQTVEIPLKGLNLSRVIGGFGFAMNADMNEKGAAFYLDEIQYVK